MKESKSRAVTSKRAAALIVVILLVGGGLYLVWAYQTGEPPFCSGYPPGGNCPGTFSNSFRISINYSGSWHATYYGFHSVGAPSNWFGGIGNYTGGSFGGAGASTRSITLSGPNTNGVTICVQAVKLDSSSNPLILAIDSMTNNTSLPSGVVRLCEGVVP